MDDQLKTIGFAAAVCVVCSLLLAGIYSALKPEQDLNKKNDLRAKVLIAFGEKVKDKNGKTLMTSKDVTKTFAEKVKGYVLDKNGKIVDVKIDQLSEEDINEREKDGLKKFYPYYIYSDSKTGKKRYAIHMSGRGLWSVVKAYMALDDDLATIVGMAFYEQQETPGLGGEVDKPYFQERFVGKKMFANNKPVDFRLIKPGSGKPAISSIDGISGATMTCNGVEKFINSDFAVYNKYFETLRR